MEKVLSALKQAMDYDQQGQWDKAHAIVQTIKHEFACRIHGYLHRKEGDMENALYWYRRIGVEPFRGDFASEKADILRRIEECVDD
jgi:hypothetical protein